MSITQAITSHKEGEFYMYTATNQPCTHCTAAKDLIETCGLPLVIRPLDGKILKEAGLTTVPQIWLGKRYIGGRRDVELFLNEMGMVPLFKRLDDNAILPTRGSDEAAGMDLYACFDPEAVAADFHGVTADLANNSVWVKPFARVCVPTGWALMVPKGTYCRIAPRGGLAVKHGLDTLAGVVDRDYRGEVIVCLINLSYEEYEIRNGDRIAQMILEKVAMPKFGVVVEGDLPDTKRGEGRYGSTGR